MQRSNRYSTRAAGHIPTPHAGAVRGTAARSTRRALIVSLVAGLLVALSAASASAVIVHVGSGRTLSYQPLRGAHPFAATPFAGTAKLLYHGGPVMPSNTNYTFYWAPSGSAAYAAGYQSGVNRYLEDLAHDSGGTQNVDSVATQYTDTSAQAANYDSHFAGAIVDTDPYPASGCKVATICLTDAQIQAEIKSYVKAHSLPEDLTHEYFMLTPPGVESCFTAAGTECSAGTPTAAYCAYHGAIADGGSTIIYANDPYVVGNSGCDSSEHPNNSPSDAALQGGLSHEHNESTTDPELNAWYASSGEENGDKCRTFTESSEYGTPLGKAPDGSRYNQLVNGDEYWYQQEWSNEGSACLQRIGTVSVTPTVSKLAPKTGPATGGTSVTITGSGLSGATAVSFGATAAASFKVNSSSSISAVAPPGTSGIVDVTVTTGAGTSATSKADQFKYKPPTVASVTPKSGPTAGGTNVTIAGSGFALGAATSFKFSTAIATGVNCTSTSSCTAVSPPRAKSGRVDVKATAGGFNSAKSAADQFTYE